MNTLLIHPESPDTFGSFKHTLEFVGKRTMLPAAGTFDHRGHADYRVT